MIKFNKTKLSGVFEIIPAVFDDNRGFFLETYHKEKYAEPGIKVDFVQDNHSNSKKGTLRGLHYQLENSQAKLVYVVKGEILDVIVDIRRGSPTFRQWISFTLSETNKKQVFVPEGFAHGFCVNSESADVIYKCTDYYHPEDEYGVLWSDPDVGIEWDVENPIITDKDNKYPKLSDIPESKLPEYSS